MPKTSKQSASHVEDMGVMEGRYERLGGYTVGFESFREDAAVMHASIWHFTGDPGDLLRRYDAMIAEIPADAMSLHLCLRTDDGIAIVDTCPSREAYLAFTAGPFAELRVRHGLPDPVALEDHPVHRAFIEGRPAVE